MFLVCVGSLHHIEKHKVKGLKGARFFTKIMADEEDNVAPEQTTEIVNDKFPVLTTMEEFQSNVLSDEEFLVVVVVTSPLCPHSNALRQYFQTLAEPKAQASKARFVQVVVPGGEEIFTALKLSRTPSLLFYLKGTTRGELLVSSNKDKIDGRFKNEVIARNEEMREYDEAKLAAMRPAEEQHDEDAEEAEEES